MTTQAFIARVAPAAASNQTKYNILASITIAQAILESGWGRSTLAVQANNLFGIKGTGPAGSFTVRTTDYRADGQPYETTAVFRKYHSWEESIEDHAKFLQSARYRSIMGETDYRKAAQALQAAGYTTDPSYPSSLIRIIEQYNLQQYDQTRPNSPVPSQSQSPSQTGTITVLANELNLRSGPGMTYPVLRVLPKDSKWQVFGESVNGWYNLGGQQWCSANPLYVSFAPLAVPSPPAALGVVEIVADVNLRSGPGSAYSIIRVLRPGERYQVFAVTSGWYNLGGQQWCSASPQHVRFTSSSRSIRVTAQTLNVRSGPGTQYPVVRQVRQNETLSSLLIQDGWHQIGPNEWVSGSFVAAL